MDKKQDLVIYHGNCADGFASAWVVKKAYEERQESEPEFFPGMYSNKELPHVADRNVILVDFSYPLDVMLAICDGAKSVLVIDHHHTAKEALEGISRPNFSCVFDMSHSGAMLTWQHYFGERTPPKLLEHIEDRDLWKFNIFGTKEIQMNVFSYPYDFEVWDKLMENPPEELLRDGVAINRKHMKDIKEFMDVVVRPMRFPYDVNELEMSYIVIPVANVPYMLGSDMCDYIIKKEEVNCAGYYYDTPKGRCFGFRSTDDFDCARIAKALGGGGHKRASGANNISATVYQDFEVSGTHVRQDLIDI